MVRCCEPSNLIGNDALAHLLGGLFCILICFRYSIGSIFQYVISVGMLLAKPRKFLYFSKLEITVDIMFDEDCLIVF